MLSIFFGYDEDAVLSVDTYFNNTYEEEWLDDPLICLENAYLCQNDG